MKSMKINLRDRSYEIVVGYDILGRLGDRLNGLNIGSCCVAVTTPVIKRIWGKELCGAFKRKGIELVFREVPDTEKSKSASACLGLLNDIALYGKGKRIFLAAFGGGVVGDLTGFIASIYKRGVPFIQIPTTLLSQVDSAIGGKVAIDLKVGKNLIGSFYQPRLVFSELKFLKTLPEAQVINGLAEVIKYGVISDKELFCFVEKNIDKVLKMDKPAVEFIVLRSSRIKAGLVEEDEFDSAGKRIALNYGHTIGHAIETASGYSNSYLHGMAISIGMIAANLIANELGLISGTDCDRIEKVLQEAGLPVEARGISPDRVYEAHRYDKKFMHKKNRFVLPVKIGKVRVVEGVPDKLVRKSIRAVCAR